MAAEKGRSLAETPTWSVATVTTLMVAACFLVERSLSRFAKWLRKTKRKAMLAALEKIREELMLLGVISLLPSQTARFISEICVPSSLFTSRFYICSENNYDDLLRNTDANQTALDKSMFGGQRLHVCSEAPSSVLVQLQHTAAECDYFSDGFQVQEITGLGEREGVASQLVQEGKDRSRHGTLTTRSVCSLDTTYEPDHETNTVCTLSRTASATSLDDQLTVATVDDEPSCIEKDV
ncbi:unnamed protein product [Miscanthus lutarioriparius]|uniref:Uncharacterized protein n=1 Tax=Miscanthus lutarioriparius TaxID=422564 RepID=A0A811QBA2_9POAL|nr:unnamed protein product [Miscanthus lutarioriparius]